MPVIEGTIGKLANVLKYVEYLSTLESQTPDLKRRRLDTLSEIQFDFPISLPALQDHHKPFIQALAGHTIHNFVLDWDIVDLAEEAFIRMSVNSQLGLTLWENTCVVSKADLDSCQKKISNNRELFVAIVLAFKSDQIRIGSIKLNYQFDALSMNVSFEIDPESKNPLMSFMKEELLTRAPDNSVQQFLQVLQPPVSDHYLEHYTSDQVVSTLAPFQTQNVEWMMKREGHYVDSSGNVCPNLSIFEKAPLLYEEKDGSLVNQITGNVENNASRIKILQAHSYRGGFLADEMGLGKTVCVISLILKHKLNQRNSFHPKDETVPDLILSGATLIIVPAIITGQWISEFGKHAPSLNVYNYKGRAGGDDISSKELAKYDVVLIQYGTLKTEINHSVAPPARSRRKAVKYKFLMSPLVEICWFRCILDEAQMIESTTTRVSQMAKAIPRWYSWAVTGTPMRKKYTDLYGLLDFLHIEQTFTPSIFSNFVTEEKHILSFFSFAKETIRRNIKSLLEGQIHIPNQYRHVVRVPFSTIEQHYYDDLWRKCREDVQLEWLDSIHWKLPVDATQDTITLYSEAVSNLRIWLLGLRQGCIHPSVIGNQNLRRIHGHNTTTNTTDVQPLSEVLDNMKNNAEEALDGHQFAYLKAKLKEGGMQEVLQKWGAALSIYLTAIPEVLELEQYHYKRIQNHISKNQGLEEESNMRLGLLKQYHQRWIFLLHQFYFYTAGVYHVLGQEDSEIAYYNDASKLRRLILEKDATRIDNEIREATESSQYLVPDDTEYKVGPRQFEIDLSLFETEEIDDEEDRENKKNKRNKKEEDDDSIQSVPQYDPNVFENIKGIGVILDTQLEKIHYLRSKLIPLLTKSYVDQKDDENLTNTGDEYTDSLSEQEMCQVYLNAYQALLQDRKFIINGTIVPLSEQLKSNNDNGEFMSEEAKLVESIEKSFRKQLSSSASFRIEYMKDTERSLRDLKGLLKNTLEAQSAIESIDSEREWIKQVLHVQLKLVDYLDDDVRKMSSLLNARIAYYKKLQHISDTLLEWSHSNPLKEIENLKKSEEKTKQLMSQARSRSQYFKTLREEQLFLSQNDKKVQKDCMICQEPIEKGMITYCGHISCFQCGITWIKSAKKCHTCTRKVLPNEWYTISYKQVEVIDRSHPQKDNNKNETHLEDKSSGSSSQELSDILKQTGNQQISGEFGAKLDSIIRHIQFIKRSSNGKCVVFSQFSKVIKMLQNGLQRNNINCMTLSNTGKKGDAARFQYDPDLTVILLHSKSHSSGLTLVAAHTVFIVEPVLNESLEKQAINRIHRIGQTHETNVYYYIMQDTIEERISSIHSTRQNRKTNCTLVEEKIELAKPSEGEGEFVHDDDLRRCFTEDESFAFDD